MSDITNENGEISSSTDTENKAPGKTQKLKRRIGIVATIAFIIFTGLFINEVIIQPYRSEQAAKETQELFKSGREAMISTPPETTSDPINDNTASVPTETEKIHDPDRDSQGRLLIFSDLLNLNPDVKGWIMIPETNIDYPVLQSGSDDPEHYLRRNINHESDKAGCIFIDYHSSVERDTQNIVLHGHNMYSTGTMFHQIPNYKDLNFYKQKPVVNFDTIFETGKWKIFSVFVTNGSSEHEKLFDYTRSEFSGKSDFLNFVYQLRVRSVLDIDVDINENDQLLTLSTCSYELKNYRTVVVARRVRDGESPDVNVETATKNEAPLYTELWYKTFGGTKPLVTFFEEALKAGEIDWYIKTSAPTNLHNSNNQSY